jgi:hypothetical protein
VLGDDVGVVDHAVTGGRRSRAVEVEVHVDEAATEPAVGVEAGAADDLAAGRVHDEGHVLTRAGALAVIAAMRGERGSCDHEAEGCGDRNGDELAAHESLLRRRREVDRGAV